jgi:hypothetical protein
MLKPGGLIAVDFDGVINSYWTRGPELVDAPEPGALEFIQRLISIGLIPIVFTTRARTRTGRKAVREWLKKYGFPEMHVTADKFAALAYVDDRAAPYIPRTGDWETVFNRLVELSELNHQRGVEDLHEFSPAMQDTNA